MRAHLRAEWLRPSWTAYMSAGKEARVRLQFSRSGEETRSLLVDGIGLRFTR